MSIPASLFTLTLAGLVLWQLIVGKALTRSWRIGVTRQDDPGTYWFIVLSQSAVLIVVLLTGKTSWQCP